MLEPTRAKLVARGRCQVSATTGFRTDYSNIFRLATRKFAVTIIESAATTVQTQATLKPKT